MNQNMTLDQSEHNQNVEDYRKLKVEKSYIG
jgi:hypothetical protein